MSALSKKTVAKYFPAGVVKKIGDDCFCITTTRDEFIFGGCTRNGYFYEYRADREFGPQVPYGDEDSLLRAVYAEWRRCGN